MPFDYRRFVRKAFESLGADNPLTKLGDCERTVLVSLAKVTDGKSVRPFKELEQIGRVAVEADAVRGVLNYMHVWCTLKVDATQDNQSRGLAM